MNIFKLIASFHNSHQTDHLDTATCIIKQQSSKPEPLVTFCFDHTPLRWNVAGTRGVLVGFTSCQIRINTQTLPYVKNLNIQPINCTYVHYC